MIPTLAFYEAAASFVSIAPSILDSHPKSNNGMTYMFYEKTEFLSNSSNVVKIAWADVQSAFKHPDHADVATHAGIDWTKPFPGSTIDGFQTHLRIANDVPFPESTVHDQFTEVTAITYSLPESMMKDGVPKAMDPSWYICRHYIVTDKIDPTGPVDHTCGFLPQECRADLESSLTENWTKEDPEYPCSALGFDYVPVSCQDYLGRITQHVEAFDPALFADVDVSKAVALEAVSQGSWMIGTGFVDAGNSTAYYEATNRTFIIGTVFGYGYSVEEDRKQTPKLSLACLRPEWVEPPQPTTTTETAAAATPFVYEPTASLW